MSSHRGSGHSSHHHRKSNLIDAIERILMAIGHFFRRLFRSVRHFFHWLFRPVRHFFRSIRRGLRSVDSRLQSVSDEADASLAARREKREAKKKYKKAKRRTRQARQDASVDAFFARIGQFFRRLFRPVRQLFHAIGRPFRSAGKKVQGISDNMDASLYEKKKKREAGRRERKAARQARLEKRLPPVVHKPGYLPGIDRARILLGLFLCIDVFGTPLLLNDFIKMFFRFASIAAFILSGYLVLREEDGRSQRIVRTIRRSALVFGVLAVVYFLLSFILYRSLGADIFAAFASKKMWFEFIVLNLWPFMVGELIWYVQAYLYAFIILYFLDKWKLMKYDWIISAVLIVFAVVVGEFCGVIRWNWHGYTYFPGFFLNRALPYILLGSFMGRRLDLFNRRRRSFYVLMIPVGVALIVLEVVGLASLGMAGYPGHMLGMPVIAVSFCMLTLKRAREPGFERLFGLSRWHINGIYYLCQPVYMLLTLAVALSGSQSSTLMNSMGFVTYILCFLLVWLIACVGRKIKRKKAKDRAVSMT